MFLKKKKEALSDQLATYQVRKSPRLGAPKFDVDCGVTITGFEGEGQLGNISVSGCSIKSVTYLNIIPDKIYQIRIIPGKEDNIKPFDLKMKLSWTKSSELVFQAGFALDSGESGVNIKRYVEQLRSRGIEPDYGNMRPAD